MNVVATFCALGVFGFHVVPDGNVEHVLAGKKLDTLCESVKNGYVSFKESAFMESMRDHRFGAISLLPEKDNIWKMRVVAIPEVTWTPRDTASQDDINSLLTYASGGGPAGPASKVALSIATENGNSIDLASIDPTIRSSSPDLQKVQIQAVGMVLSSAGISRTPQTQLYLDSFSAQRQSLVQDTILLAIAKGNTDWECKGVVSTGLRFKDLAEFKMGEVLKFSIQDQDFLHAMHNGKSVVFKIDKTKDHGTAKEILAQKESALKDKTPEKKISNLEIPKIKKGD